MVLELQISLLSVQKIMHCALLKVTLKNINFAAKKFHGLHSSVTTSSTKTFVHFANTHSKFVLLKL